MDILSSLGNAIGLVKRLREISRNVAEAEFKNVLADLASELADAKLEASVLKSQVAELSEELRLLKATAPRPDEKPKGTKWGCYVFEGDEGLYCTGCWDSKRQKSLTNRATSRFRMCPVCRATIGT